MGEEGAHADDLHHLWVEDHFQGLEVWFREQGAHQAEEDDDEPPVLPEPETHHIDGSVARLGVALKFWSLPPVLGNKGAEAAP